MWRKPDEIIGNEEKPYLLRWWLFKSKYVSIYLHRFLRDDEDRALHNHPAASLSFASGEYMELVGSENFSLGKKLLIRKRFLPVFRKASHIHRIILFKARVGSPIPVWTIFIFFKKTQEWGFFCPQGFRHWSVFCDERDKGKVGRGCD